MTSQPIVTTETIIDVNTTTDVTVNPVQTNIFSGIMIKNAVLTIIVLITLIRIMGLIRLIYLRRRDRNTRFTIEMEQLNSTFSDV